MQEHNNMTCSTTRSVFFLCFVGGIKAWLINQPAALQTVELGDSVTIECYLPKKDFNSMVWYKQELGMIPEPVAKDYNYLQDVTYLNGFKDGRFTVSTGKGIFHLTISAIKNEDSATYFCGIIALNELRFGSGTLLIIKGLQFSNQTVLQNPVANLFYPGDNVILNCTFEIVEPSCPEPHSVYWFKDGSVKTHSAITNMHENGDGQCEKTSKTDSPAQSCVYKLPKRNLSLSDAGTYYCAVLMCGEIIFGNGTKLSIADGNSPATVSLTYLILVSSNIISVLVMIIIIVIRLKNQVLSAGSSNCQASLDTHDACEEALNYAALSFNSKPPSSRGTRRQQKLQDAGVYSQVKYEHQS
ncbi:novel immune-type receptor 8 [Pygocentrus nattereri]|uniref:Ig-like domain-containing protein n=1 Tax=Pygocentrus nattereri TaxID=42514 RepID=A0A3B4C7R8_PYGNA|nr:novel immune-type receptor 8 [Pygocentrus nattereri]